MTPFEVLIQLQLYKLVFGKFWVDEFGVQENFKNFILVQFIFIFFMWGYFHTELTVAYLTVI